MTWPFENDTSDIEKKLAKRSLHRERQRNLFAIIALVLTAFTQRYFAPFDTRLLRALHSRNPQKHSPFGTFSSNERKNF